MSSAGNGFANYWYLANLHSQPRRVGHSLYYVSSIETFSTFSHLPYPTVALDKDSVLPGGAANDACECSIDAIDDDGICGE